MALLITVFLVLINIFNNITTNSPKSEGLTAIEIWMMACILFVFGMYPAFEYFSDMYSQTKLTRDFDKRTLLKIATMCEENGKSSRTLGGF